MKILYIVESAATGVGRHLLDLIDGVLAVGHQVDVIYSPTREDAIFRAGRERLSMTGVRFVAAPMRRAPGPWDAAAVSAVRRHIADHGPYDVVHGHSSKGGMAARLAGIGGGARIVYTPHAISTLDPTLSPLKRMVYHAGEWALCGLTDAVIAVSTGEAAHLKALGMPPRKINVVLNAIEPPDAGTRPRAAVRAELGLADNHLAIGFVGRLGRHKAIDVMVAAFAQVWATHPDARLIVIGDGEDRAAAQRQAAALGCDGAVRWLGACDALGYYAGFDLLAQPSRYEGLSYTLLEAAALGLPVVATDVGGTRDVLTDGDNGLVVSAVGDAFAFAAALRTLATDSPRMAALADGARRRIVSGGVGRMAAATLAVYGASADGASADGAAEEGF